MHRRLRIGALVVAIAVLSAACGGDDDDAQSTNTSTTKKQVTTTTGAPVIAPLTGLQDPTGTSQARGALAVKIDNANTSRRPPQAGLDVADVVYEEPVEGITRFLAIFHSTLPPRIGPVRSTRFIDPGLVWNLGGLYVYSGGTEEKVAAIQESPIQTVDENGLVAAGARIRDDGIRKPHNLFVVPDVLWAWDQVRDRTPPQPLFAYLADGGRFGGDPAATVEIPTLSRARYTWDAANGVWKREALNGGSDGPVEHATESGAPVAPTNIVVQAINGLESASVLVGEGDAWVCSQGRCVQGRWSRASLEAPTVFNDANGSPVALTPGTTWVHLVTDGAPTITP